MLLQAHSCRDFLSGELDRRIKLNPRYSQRAFARQLGLSAGELSEIMRGRRNLSLKSALRIAQSLGLNATETRHLLFLSQVEKSRDLPASQLLTEDAELRGSHQLHVDMFQVVSDWYCFGILNLADTLGFKFDTVWIAKRLGISQSEARIALERLERVGLIERKNGRLRITQDYVMSNAGIPSEAIRNYHRQMLAKASLALDEQPVHERHFSGIGFALDPAFFPEIQKDITEFQERLTKKYARGKKTEVYHIETAFFRVSEKSPAPSVTTNPEKPGVKNED